MSYCIIVMCQFYLLILAAVQIDCLLIWCVWKESGISSAEHVNGKQIGYRLKFLAQRKVACSLIFSAIQMTNNLCGSSYLEQSMTPRLAPHCASWFNFKLLRKWVYELQVCAFRLPSVERGPDRQPFGKRSITMVGVIYSVVTVKYVAVSPIHHHILLCKYYIALRTHLSVWYSHNQTSNRKY